MNFSRSHCSTGFLSSWAQFPPFTTLLWNHLLGMNYLPANPCVKLSVRGQPRLRGFPGGASAKESACQGRRCKRRGFDPWVRKIPWRRNTPLQYSWLPLVTHLVKKKKKFCLQCMRPWFNSWVRKIPWRRDRLPTPVFSGFPGGSDAKESACNAGDLGLIHGLGGSPGGGHGNPLQDSCLENPHGQRRLTDYCPWGLKESDTTEHLIMTRELKKQNSVESEDQNDTEHENLDQEFSPHFGSSLNLCCFIHQQREF